jgi:uncharacterized membrane protein YjfL (UPF0719 family)
MNPLLVLVSSIIQIILGILFGCFSIYLGFRFFDKLTVGIDELSELKKGNIAVAILLVFLSISIGIMLLGVIKNILQMFGNVVSPAMFIITFIMAIVQIVVSIILVSLVVYVGLKIYDSLTPTIDEIKEIKKGNIAIAIVLGGVILVISLLVSTAIDNFVESDVFSPRFLAGLIGIPVQ